MWKRRFSLSLHAIQELILTVLVAHWLRDTTRQLHAVRDHVEPSSSLVCLSACLSVACESLPLSSVLHSSDSLSVVSPVTHPCIRIHNRSLRILKGKG